ncbi:dethiobiotin synthase [Anaplasma bovis]|uniref:dethiobiotin synthase n=1 Tax=Anaplasma bovis TaxID=186733 RepID=UPI002FF00439
MSVYFITSCGTDIGKTFITTALCWHSRRIGNTVQAIKPVVSGWDNAWERDTCKIIRSLGLGVTESSIEAVSPWRLAQPRTPSVAASMLGESIEYKDVLSFCAKVCANPCDYTFIEGTGGVMSPITRNSTALDLIKDLESKVILVIGSYLGCISHTFTALEVLKDRKVRIVMTLKEENDVYSDDIISSVREFYGQEVYVQQYVNRNGSTPWVYTSPEIVNFIES